MDNNNNMKETFLDLSSSFSHSLVGVFGTNSINHPNPSTSMKARARRKKKIPHRIASHWLLYLSIALLWSQADCGCAEKIIMKWTSISGSTVIPWIKLPFFCNIKICPLFNTLFVYVRFFLFSYVLSCARLAFLSSQ